MVFLYRQVFWLKRHRSAAPSRFPSGMRRTLLIQRRDRVGVKPTSLFEHKALHRLYAGTCTSIKFFFITQPVYTIAVGISTKIFYLLLSSPSLNFSWIALTARSASCTSTNTDIFISEVVIIWIFISAS